ncbi:hypothetical protein HYPSUDRAFT_54080 [Hypholoma sublateritium FD-334 SS-4]|uniref:Uncharacterized protein n=1 Tax=Hypholoma sublateritium (strain FD-334 SS-4) TaxID=945553 RepID=A0A0D2PWN3_HYPSF|nr:hypothetical protein HYPSUDRAFT_54080 [Hypholoma sublateritium FD-334 SS-4]
MFSESQVTLAYSTSASQITLTNPLPALELYSLKRSVTNTVLSHSGKPYISISTVDNAASTDKLLVTIQRRTIAPDTITFHQRFDDQTLKIKDWLVELKTGDTRIREWLVRKPIGNFIWRSTIDIRLAPSLSRREFSSMLSTTWNGLLRGLIQRRGRIMPLSSLNVAQKASKTKSSPLLSSAKH